MRRMSLVGPQSTRLIRRNALRLLPPYMGACVLRVEEFKNTHPDVDWRKISGLRNILVHDYLGIDLETVWNILARDLPGLKKAL